jgi:polar amino acid transport system substrate-binding protein
MTRCLQSIRWAAALCMALAAAGPQAAAPLTLYTEDYPPFNWRDGTTGKATGLSVDIVNELLLRAGVSVAAFNLVPWARGMAQTGANPNTCLFSTTRTPQREASFTWIGPIARNEWVMFARSDENIVLRSLVDARRYQVGTIIDDAIIPFLLDKQMKLSQVGSHRQNLIKLRARRIELWATGRLPGLHVLRTLGIEDVEPVYSIAQYDLYLACHKDSNKAEIKRLNEVLRGMYRDGTVQRIYAYYGYDKEVPRVDAAAR